VCKITADVNRARQGPLNRTPLYYGTPETLFAPLLTDVQIKALDVLYRKRLQSMLGVVETIEGIIQTLYDTGQLDNT
jgi:hypothetical protein